MLAFNLSDLGVNGGIGAIVVACIVLGVIKGLIRMAFGMIALVAGVIGGFWGFQKGASIAGTVVASPDPWMSAVVGLVIGLGIFFVARALFGVLLTPAGGNAPSAKPLAFPGGVLGLFAGGVFAWFCLAGIRFVGTVAELDWIKTSITSDKEKIVKSPPPFLVKLKRALDASGPGQFHEKYDILNDRAQANLAKLTVLLENKGAFDGALGEQNVRQAVNEKNVREMLEKKSADVRTFIESGQYAHLLSSDPIRDACESEEAVKLLEVLDLEKTIGLIQTEEAEPEEAPEGEPAKE